MSKSPLKVLFVSAEVAPFSSVGGLSQVSYFLPRALYKLGLDIRIFTPKYGTIDEKKFPLKTVINGMKVPTGEEENSQNPKDLICNVKAFAEVKKSEPTVYFLENMEYFEKRANVYGYSDDHIRFGLLSRGALEFLKNNSFEPDLIQANDWHTGYLINYLRNVYKDDPKLKDIAALFSAHNLYQGIFDYEHASDMDFDDGKGNLAGFFTDRFFKQNALKRGIIYADIVNTVSENYAKEITTSDYGKGLNNLFKELRGKVYGILNGLDYTDFNPQTDKLIKRNYNFQTIGKRAENKVDLQNEFNLTPDPEIPLISFWGRIEPQKGIDLIMETIPFLLKEQNVQFVIMGPPANDEYRKFFEKLEADFPGKVGTHLMSNFALPRKIAAGADILLHPSKYEPGGIVAMEALRYGTIPVVRATGGLADIVKDFDPNKGTGTGFTFTNFNSQSFLVAIVRAIETYKNKEVWRRLVRSAMEKDFSWVHTAEKYVDIYDRAIKFHKDSLLPNPPRLFRE